jgi:peptide/nickel transport system substrate-binding protein
MKKSLFIASIVVVLLAGTPFDGSSQQTPASGKPQYGGILREVMPNSPKVLSYYPEMGPTDEIQVLPGVERLMDYNQDRQLVPFLARSVDIDRAKKAITIRLKKGIKFHDGTEMKADDVYLSYKLPWDSGRLQCHDKLKSIQILDDYTLVLQLTEYHNQIINGLGWVPVFSKTAWDKAGGGDVEKSKAWARANVVGTGPFMLAEYKRDVSTKWVKNKNYWQSGKPYLDGIEVRYIPDPVTASAMMQAGEADYWDGPAKDAADLSKKGFVIKKGYGSEGIIYINTKDPNSKFQDKRLREAIEYALDKPTIAKALGFGLGVPLTTVASPGDWAYDPGYKGRPYDPKKAKELIAAAGYPNGLNIKLTAVMAGPHSKMQAEAIKRYLDDVGMTVDLDIADSGRFFTMLFKEGWPDLILASTGTSVNSLVNFQRQFGHEPQSNYVNYRRSPELIALSKQSLNYDKEADQIAVSKKLVRLLSEEALVIPVYLVPFTRIVAPNVHTTFLREFTVTRQTFDEWIDKTKK